MVQSALANQTRISTQSSSRAGATIDTMLWHHQAGTNDDSVIDSMVSWSRGTSANYTIRSDGRLTLVVPEELRAWTSGSPDDGGKGAAWDRRSITVEIENESGDPTWGISDAAIATAAALTLDVEARYGRKMQHLGHRDLYTAAHDYASYPTYCPGPNTVARIVASVNSGGGSKTNLKEGHVAKNVFYCTDIRGFSPKAMSNKRGMFIVAGAPTSAKDRALFVTENEDLVNVFLRSRGMDAHDLPAIGFGDLTQMLRWEIGFDTLTDGTIPGKGDGSAMVDGFTWGALPSGGTVVGGTTDLTPVLEAIAAGEAADAAQQLQLLAAIGGVDEATLATFGLKRTA